MDTLYTILGDNITHYRTERARNLQPVMYLNLPLPNAREPNHKQVLGSLGLKDLGCKDIREPSHKVMYPEKG